MAEGRGFYSRMVAILKVGLPLISLGLLSSIFLAGPDRDGGGEITFSRADLAALGSGLRVDNPTFAGVTRREDRFEFQADVVIPDAAPPTRANIENLRGRVDFKSGVSVEVSARRAELEMDRQSLDLQEAPRVATSDGLVVIAAKMQLDLGAGALTASGGVTTSGPMGDITSADLRIDPAEGDSASRLISFGNGVRLIYHPGAEAK